MVAGSGMALVRAWWSWVTSSVEPARTLATTFAV